MPIIRVPSSLKRKDQPARQDEQPQDTQTDTPSPDYLFYDEDAHEVLFKENRFPDATFPYAKHFSDDRDTWDMTEHDHSGVTEHQCQKPNSDLRPDAKRGAPSHNDAVLARETTSGSSYDGGKGEAVDVLSQDVTTWGTSDWPYRRSLWFSNFRTQQDAVTSDVAATPSSSSTNSLSLSESSHIAPSPDARFSARPYLMRDVMWLEPDWVIRKTQVKPTVEPRAHMYFGMLITIIFFYPRIVSAQLPDRTRFPAPARRQWWWLRTILGLLLAARMYLCGIPEGI